MTIGEQLRSLRQAAGLTQVELAQRLDASQASISQTERGVGTTSGLIVRWVEACGGVIQLTRPTDALEATVAQLGPEDRAHLLQIARALPKIPEGVPKNAVISALSQMAGLK